MSEYQAVRTVNIIGFPIYKLKDQALIELGIGDSTQKILFPAKHVCLLLSKDQNQNFSNKTFSPLGSPMCFLEAIPSQQITLKHTEITRSTVTTLRICFQISLNKEEK